MITSSIISVHSQMRLNQGLLRIKDLIIIHKMMQKKLGLEMPFIQIFNKDSMPPINYSDTDFVSDDDFLVRGLQLEK